MDIATGWPSLISTHGYIHGYIHIHGNPVKTTVSIITKFCRVIEIPKYSPWVVQMCPNKSKMADGHHLEKSKNLNIFATD